MTTDMKENQNQRRSIYEEVGNMYEMREEEDYMKDCSSPHFHVHLVWVIWI